MCVSIILKNVLLISSSFFNSLSDVEWYSGPFVVCLSMAALWHRKLASIVVFCDMLRVTINGTYHILNYFTKLMLWFILKDIPCRFVC